MAKKDYCSCIQLSSMLSLACYLPAKVQMQLICQPHRHLRAIPENGPPCYASELLPSELVYDSHETGLQQRRARFMLLAQNKVSHYLGCYIRDECHANSIATNQEPMHRDSRGSFVSWRLSRS